jgi:hypothetical protein
MNSKNFLKNLKDITDLTPEVQELIENSFSPPVEDLLTETTTDLGKDKLLTVALKAQVAAPGIASAANKVESTIGRNRNTMKGRSARDVAFGMRLAAAAISKRLSEDS